jgi:HAD superfamily hydrolase (TIGR01490 family)
VAQDIHVFDVDHTVIRGSTGLHFIREGLASRVLPLVPVVTAPLLYWRYRMLAMAERAERFLIAALRGISRVALERAARASFSARILPDLYQDAAHLIRDLKARGSDVVLATLSVDLIIRPLAEYLGIETVIASEFEFADGQCTGRFVGGPLLSAQKRDRVLGYLRKKGADASGCAFYSDSINDLPLLEAVGRPVAINPDARLSTIAADRGWEVRSWR